MPPLPTATFGDRKIPRLIFSIKPASGSSEEIHSLMLRIYEEGAWCFDVPTPKYYRRLKELRELTDDATLIGVAHIGADEGASLSGIPLHRFEERINATLLKSLFPADLARSLRTQGLWKPPYVPAASPSSEVLTKKEVDRIRYDASRFDAALSAYLPSLSPLLMIGERYGDFLLGLGRIDLLHDMVRRAGERGFIPILSGQWATFLLPKAKSLNVAGYAVPINRTLGLFELSKASDVIRKFDRPVISLEPFAGRGLSADVDDALAFLFADLKIHGAVAEVSAEDDLRAILRALRKFGSVRPPRRASSPP